MNKYNHKDIADECDALATAILTVCVLASLIGAIIVCL